MSKQIKHQEDSYNLAQRIRRHEITLQVIPGESSKGIEEIRTVTGIPGEGDNNDMVSIRMALELGLIIRASPHQRIWTGVDDKPLDVVGISKLKIRRRGPFGVEPHWTDVWVHVMYNLQKDMLLSWPTQRELQLI